MRRLMLPCLLALAACSGADGTPPQSAGVRAPADVLIADQRVFPESLSADSAGTLYIGSVKGNVYRSIGGAPAEPWIRLSTENPAPSILGVLVDERSNTLWLCSVPSFTGPRGQGISELRAFDLNTGAAKGRYPFPDPKPGACNDIAVDASGTAFVTDTPNGRILTLAPGASELQLFAADASMKGIDGLAFAEDGTLYINNVQTHEMARIDRGPDGRFAGVTKLNVSMQLNGPDGLRPLGGNRFIQAEGPAGRVSEVTINGDRADVRVLREGLESSAGAAPAGSVAYATEGKINYLFDPKLKDQDPGEFRIRVIPLESR
jgi:hypothetical protein